MIIRVIIWVLMCVLCVRQTDLHGAAQVGAFKVAEKMQAFPVRERLQGLDLEWRFRLGFRVYMYARV